VLARRSQDPLQGTLALTFAALVLLVLANVFPFLEINLEGQVRENTIATGVVGLWNGGARALATLILFTTILAPLLRILGLLYVLFPLSLGRVPPGVASTLRFQGSLVTWAMLDVYMLALLVMLVKMAGMATIQLETGAWCFGALFIVLTLVSAFYDREALWDRVEALR
jgi:paraquat-inducible protein A